MIVASYATIMSFARARQLGDKRGSVNRVLGMAAAALIAVGAQCGVGEMN